MAIDCFRALCALQCGNNFWLIPLLLNHFANLLVFVAWAIQSSHFQNLSQLPHLLFQSSHSLSAQKTDHSNTTLAYPSWGHCTTLKPLNVSLSFCLDFEELTALCSEMLSKTPQGFVSIIRIPFQVTKSKSKQSSGCYFFPLEVWNEGGTGKHSVKASKKEGGRAYGGVEKLVTELVRAFLWRQGGGQKKKGICVLIECFLIYCKHKQPFIFSVQFFLIRQLLAFKTLD